jgi:alpha-N-arabinofuranosidase
METASVPGKTIPHPIDVWNDRPNSSERRFLQLCEKIVSHSRDQHRAREEALTGSNTAWATRRPIWKTACANGRAGLSPRLSRSTTSLAHAVRYLKGSTFCPAIRAKYPNLKLSVAGSYGYDTGPGEGNQEANRNWDPRIIADAGKLFDILSPHYYNGIFFTADFVEDPYKYEQFLKSRAEIIQKSENPNIKIYVSEWNLTNNRWGNDWRVGLYAGGILNAFERQADIVTMSCPALFLRKQGVTKDWDNALINFDQKSWFPAGNYVVMKLWRDSFAPHLLAVDGPDRPLNFVATRSADKQAVFLKAVNPTGTAVEVAVRLDGDLMPRTATMQLIAPGSDTVKNSIEQPDNIKVVTATATVESSTVKFTLPPLSVGVVRVTP